MESGQALVLLFNPKFYDNTAGRSLELGVGWRYDLYAEERSRSSSGELCLKQNTNKSAWILAISELFMILVERTRWENL